jgi:hypothetical protein
MPVCSARAILPVLLVALMSATGAQEYRDLKTPDDLPNFFQTYYQKPRPELKCSQPIPTGWRNGSRSSKNLTITRERHSIALSTGARMEGY